MTVETRTKKAWLMNSIIAALNDEEAYYSSWLYLWPDGETEQECRWDFGENEANFKELRQLFYELYKTYQESGICNATQEQLDYCHKLDEKFGLKPIQNLIYKVY